MHEISGHFYRTKGNFLIWSDSQTCSVKTGFIAGSSPDCRSMGPKSQPQPCHITFVEIDHEKMSTAILQSAVSRREVVSLLVKACALSTGYPLRRSMAAQEQCKLLCWCFTVL